MKIVLRAALAAIILCSFLAPSGSIQAQDDGRIVFTDPKSKDEKVLSEEDLRPRVHAWGADIMLGDDGFGLGFFYSRAFDDEIAAFADLSLSEAKDSRQMDYVDPYGVPYSPNKINHVYRVPLFFGLQYRLFKDDIADNFRPFVNGAAGPVLLFIASADRDFFSGLGHGRARYTYGGFLGAGANFGLDRSSVIGVNIRYYIIPMPAGIRSVEQGDMRNADGFFITLNFGSSF